jgi:hypothetical protein
MPEGGSQQPGNALTLPKDSRISPRPSSVLGDDGSDMGSPASASQPKTRKRNRAALLQDQTATVYGDDRLNDLEKQAWETTFETKWIAEFKGKHRKRGLKLRPDRAVKIQGKSTGLFSGRIQDILSCIVHFTDISGL